MRIDQAIILKLMFFRQIEFSFGDLFLHFTCASPN